MNISYPYSIGKLGRTASADENKHLRDLIEQVLFTAPGERVMRPNFGSGVYQLIFAPVHDALAVTVRQTIQAALQQWLGDRLTVEEVLVNYDDAKVHIEVKYRPMVSGEITVASFERAL